MPTLEQQVADTVRRQVAAGFQSRADIIDCVQESYVDEIEREWLLSTVPTMVDDALRQHHRAQLAWPTITDCDRLDTASMFSKAKG